jgi:hypothetical protein
MSDHRDFYYQTDPRYGSGRSQQDHGAREHGRDRGRFGRRYPGYADYEYAEQGPFAGVGPKGYVRTDERIREAVCEILTDDSWLDACDIDVEVKDGEVVLAGTVRDGEQRRLAETVAGRTAGVRHVQNNLRMADE